MHIKFFDRGRGKGAGPVDYCVSEEVTVSAGRSGAYRHIKRDPAPEVLRGNPELTKSLIDSLEFKHKYTSGVIAFHRDDNPTEEQQQRLMDDFEELAFAGLKKSNVNILWVKHVHCGNVELHMVVPRVELSTGKSLNIAPPGWNKFYDCLRDAWNHEQDWARPDDPARARLVQLEREFGRKGELGRNSCREYVSKLVEMAVENGVINSRESLLEYLEEHFKISRISKKYVSIEYKKNIKLRLKGKFYNEDFNWNGVCLSSQSEGKWGTGNTGPIIDPGCLARRNLEKWVSKRAIYNKERYGTLAETQGLGFSFSLERHLLNTIGKRAILLDNYEYHEIINEPVVNRKIYDLIGTVGLRNKNDNKGERNDRVRDKVNKFIEGLSSKLGESTNRISEIYRIVRRVCGKTNAANERFGIVNRGIRGRIQRTREAIRGTDGMFHNYKQQSRTFDAFARRFSASRGLKGLRSEKTAGFTQTRAPSRS